MSTPCSAFTAPAYDTREIAHVELPTSHGRDAKRVSTGHQCVNPQSSAVEFLGSPSTPRHARAVERDAMGALGRGTALAVVLGLVVAAPAAADTDPGIHEWQPVPRDRVAAECGMDPDLLESGTAHLVDTPFVVVRYGKLCWEGGYPGGTTQTYHIASVTKTFGALLTGMVDARSTLSDEDVVTRWIDARRPGRDQPRTRGSRTSCRWPRRARTCATARRRSGRYDTLGDREINRLVGVMNKAIAGEPGAVRRQRATPREFAQREMFDRARA